MHGSEDDVTTLPPNMGDGYVYLPAVTTLQLISAAVWLNTEEHKAAELRTDTAGFLHVSSGDERAVFALDGTDA